jgi:hypothetical protein
MWATSCTKDLRESRQSDWCVVCGRGDFLYFVSDDEEILRPDETLDSLMFQAGDRYKIYYMNLEGDGLYPNRDGKDIKLEEFEPVLVKNIVTAEVNGYTDLVRLNRTPFFGGGYLNLDFSYGLTLTSGILHQLQLVQDSTRGRILQLRFVHNAKGDLPRQAESALMSFPLASLRDKSQADSLYIRVSERADRVKIYRLALRDTL